MPYSAVTWTTGDVITETKLDQMTANEASFNDGTGIASGAITPAKLTSAAATSWPWQDYTPSYVNITVGDGTVVSKYAYIGKTIHVLWRLTFGSTSAIGGANPTISYPVVADSPFTESAAYVSIGNCVMQDATGSAYGGAVWILNGAMQPVFFNGSAVASGISNTLPFTWATSDKLSILVTYEAA